MWTAALFGLFHGINPGMGWLFAVYRAMHRRDRSELYRSLWPITLGHAASVGLVVLLVALARSTLPIQPLRYASAGLLLAMGLYQLSRYYRHLAWSGMNLSARDLALWSFLGATAHGSGLMLAPLALGAAGGGQSIGLVLLHTAAMLLSMYGGAVLVHDRLNLSHLRRFWVNFDLIWAASLLVIGALSLLAAWSHTHT